MLKRVFVCQNCNDDVIPKVHIKNTQNRSLSMIQIYIWIWVMMMSGKLIHIPLDEGGSVGGIAAGTASVLALLGLGVGLATSLEDSHVFL